MPKTPKEKEVTPSSPEDSKKSSPPEEGKKKEKSSSKAPKSNMAVALAVAAVVVLIIIGIALTFTGGKKVVPPPNVIVKPPPVNVVEPVEVPAMIQGTELEVLYVSAVTIWRRNTAAIIAVFVVVSLLVAIGVGISAHYENQRIAEELELERLRELKRLEEQERLNKRFFGINPEKLYNEVMTFKTENLWNEKGINWPFIKNIAMVVYGTSLAMTVALIIFDGVTGWKLFFENNLKRRVITYFLCLASLSSIIGGLIALFVLIISTIKFLLLKITGQMTLVRVLGAVVIFALHLVTLCLSILFIPMGIVVCLMSGYKDILNAYMELWIRRWSEYYTYLNA